jgi:hypothetical protein
MMGEVKIIKQYNDGELYATAEKNCLAVRTSFGYSSSGESGLHNQFESFAIAELGYLDNEGSFNDFKNVCAEGWSSETDEINWHEYAAWADKYCKEQLIETPSYTFHDAVAIRLAWFNPSIETIVEDWNIAEVDAIKVREILDQKNGSIERG